MSTKFTTFSKTTGKIIYRGTASDPSAFETTEIGVVMGESYDDGWIDVDGYHPLGAMPSTIHTFNYITKQWEDPRTLDDIKTQQWGQIKLARTAAEYAGFVWGGSAFDSDMVSQNRITGAVTLAQLSPAFTIDWTLQNNTVRTLGQADMIAVGAALGVHVQTQFAKGQALRAQIDAATTQAEVEAVVW